MKVHEPRCVNQVATQARARKRLKWQWLQTNTPAFAAMIVEMKAAGLDPQEPQIFWDGEEVNLREVEDAKERRRANG